MLTRWAGVAMVTAVVEHMRRDQELIGLNPAVQTAFSHLFLSLHQFLHKVSP